MKEQQRNIHIINPVDSDFLSHICKEISKDEVVDDFDFYTCEVCNKRFPFSKMTLHKDFLLCDNCVKERNLDYEIISLVTFLEESL